MCEQRDAHTCVNKWGQCEQHGVWRDAMAQRIVINFALWLSRSQTLQISPAEHIEWTVMIPPLL